MIIRRLTATNYRSWRDLDLELPQGVAAITGPNGAGKTSILSAIDTCLFGGNLRDALTAGETTCTISVAVQHGGTTYRVERAYTAKGGGKTSLDLYAIAAADSALTPLTAESQKATQDRLEHLLGLSRDTWRASAYLAQRDGSFADPSVSPRDRKRLLADALGLDVWSRLLEQASRDRADAEHEATTLTGRISQLTVTAEDHMLAETMLAAARADRDNARQHAADFAVELERATSAVESAIAADTEARAIRQRRDGAEQRAAGANRRAAEIAARIDRIATAGGDRSKFEAAAARVDELEDAHRQAVAAAVAAAEAEAAYVAERDRLTYQRDRARDAAIRATAAYDRLVADQQCYQGQIDATRDQPDTPCHACGQTLPDDARRQVVAGLETTLAGVRGDTDHRAKERDAADALAADADALLAKLVEPARANPRDREAAEHAARQARSAATALAELDAAERQVADLEQQRTAELDVAAAAQVEADEANTQLAALTTTDVDAQRAHRTRIAALLEGAQSAVTAAEQRIGAADARLAQALAARQQLADANERAADLSREVGILAACCQAYGPNGIPAMILETSAIPQLEVEADRVLAELGTSYRVELRTQRAKRSSDGLIETLDVVIITPDGERGFEHFSGGEQTRINLALRLALAQLLASRRGADVRVFLVDEPEGLDAAGMEAFARILRDLDATFESILVVSHHSDLRDSFDQVIDVAHDDAGASTITSGRATVIA